MICVFESGSLAGLLIRRSQADPVCFESWAAAAESIDPATGAGLELEKLSASPGPSLRLRLCVTRLALRLAGAARAAAGVTVTTSKIP
jgi:hypothetical protein